MPFYMNIEVIKPFVLQQFSLFNEESIQKAYRAVRTLVEAVITKEAGYIEKY